MTPEERQLITGLFDRMRGFTLTEKDSEAEALIKAQVSGLPDAPYMLVQSVLVQEHALQQADARIKALEDEVRQLQAAQRRSAQESAPAAGSGSFLGGLFGSRAAPGATTDRGASVPAVGARATPPVYGGSPAWAAPQAGAQQPGASGGQQQFGGGGGGFLRSAMATAAGVAGGMLAANAISSWLGSGSSSTPQPTQTAAADTTGATPTSQPAEAQQADYHEAAYEEEDDGGWFGDDGGDFDI